MPHEYERVALPLKTSKVRALQSTLNAFDMSILMMTSGSEGLEFRDEYIMDRILAQ